MTPIITEPGFYKTASGEKAEVVSIRGGVAIRWMEKAASCSWNAANGWCVSYPDRNITSPWTEPRTLTMWVGMFLSEFGNIYTVWSRSKVEQNAKCLSLRKVTLIEGEFDT